MKLPDCRLRRSIAVIRRRSPPWRYCSASALISVSMAVVIWSSSRRRVFPGEITQHEHRENDEHDKIGRRQFEGAGADHLPEGRPKPPGWRGGIWWPAPGGPSLLAPSLLAMIADHIARAPHGMEQGSPLPAVNLAAQAGNMHVNHIGLRIKVIIQTFSSSIVG